MTRNIRIIQLCPAETNRLERLCSRPDPDLESDAVIFSRGVEFDEDRIAYVQVISDRNPQKKPCCTQAVLFQRGVTDELIELACTPPGTTVLGEYNMRLGDSEYMIDVIVDKNEEV